MSQRTKTPFSSLQSLIAAQQKQSKSSRKNSSKHSAPDQKKPTIPTDDEIGAQLIHTWQGNYAYFWERWNRYEKGFWRKEHNINLPIWGAMKAAKPLGYRPTNGKCSSVQNYLHCHLLVPDEQIDRQDHLINLRNGIYDLNTGKLIPHQREFYQTSQLDFAFEPAAECPLWMKCLDQWLITPTGEPDCELQQFVQEAVGYTLTTDTSYQVGFILYGPAASGKSQVINVIQMLLGDAHGVLDLGALDRNTYQLAQIAGKRALTCTEAASGMILKDDTIKKLMSGEIIKAREIYHSSFDCKPVAKVWWGANELPQNLDRSNAIYRRFRIIPFNRAILPGEQDPGLSKKLRAELPGIFNWALVGLARLHQNGGFTPAAQIDEQVQLYKEANDTEAAFLANSDWIVRGTGGKTKASEFYIAHYAWCERFGHRAKSSIKVVPEWIRLGLERVKERDCNYYHGVELTPMAVEVVRRRQQK